MTESILITHRERCGGVTVSVYEVRTRGLKTLFTLDLIKALAHISN